MNNKTYIVLAIIAIALGWYWFKNSSNEAPNQKKGKKGKKNRKNKKQRNRRRRGTVQNLPGNSGTPYGPPNDNPSPDLIVG